VEQDIRQLQLGDGPGCREAYGPVAGYGLGLKLKGFCLGRFLPKLKVTRPTVVHGSSLWLEITSSPPCRSSLLGLSSTGGGSNCLQIDPAVFSVKSSSPFAFPPLSAPKLLPPVTMVVPLAP
jgi:hypothetical protein